MLFVCPDLSPSCLFHCHHVHRGVDKFVRLWGWDVEYCCTLYFYGRLSKYLHNYMHLRTPSPSSTPLHHPWGVSSPVLNPGLNGQPHHSCLNLPATSPLQTNTFGVHQHGQAFNYRRHSIITVMGLELELQDSAHSTFHPPHFTCFWNRHVIQVPFHSSL